MMFLLAGPFLPVTLATLTLGLAVAVPRCIRWARAYAFARKNFHTIDGHGCVPVASPRWNWRIFSAPALGTTRQIFSAEDASIFSIRVSFAEAYGPIYLAHGWNMRALLPWTPTLRTLTPVMIFVSDGALASEILNASDMWIKTNGSSGPLIKIASRAVTNQNGEVARRQRAAVHRAMPGRREIAARTAAAATQLAEAFISALSQDGMGEGDSLMGAQAARNMDVMPLVSDAAFGIMFSIIFGDKADLTSFKAAFLKLWDILRQNATNWSEVRRRERGTALDVSVAQLRVHIESLVLASCKSVRARQTKDARDWQEYTQTCGEKKDQEKEDWAGGMLGRLAQLGICEHNRIRSGCKQCGGSVEKAAPDEWLEEEEVIHNLFNLMTASFETITHTVAATLYFLACNTSVQADVRRSLGASQGGHTDSVLLRACIRESIRLLPVVLQLKRVSVRAGTVGRYACPKNTAVIVDVAAMHRSRANWGPAPLAFDPTRHFASRTSADERVIVVSQHWMPFGAGAKACMGQVIAFEAAEALLAAAVVATSHLAYTRTPPPHLTQSPTLRFADGLYVHVALCCTLRAHADARPDFLRSLALRGGFDTGETQAKRRFRMADVRRHCTATDAWIVVKERVYDCSVFLDKHPGGPVVIIDNAGTDCTEIFTASHSAQAWKDLEGFYIGDLLTDSADATELAAGAAGEIAPSAASAAATGTLDPTKWVPVTLVCKKDESRDTKRLRFALPTAQHVLGLPIGSHFLVRATGATGATGVSPASRCVRAYTPTSLDDDVGFVELVVKVYYHNENLFPHGGTMSQHLGALEMGDTIEIKGPVGHFSYLGGGRFKLRDELRECMCMGMLCGGTGITPAYQVIKAALKDKEDKTQFYLLYANQTAADVLLRAQLDAWAKEYPARLHVWYTVDKVPEGIEWPFSVGFIDEDMIKKHMPKPGLNGESFVAMCGPPPMIKFACIPNLEKAGYTDRDYMSF